MTGALAVQIRRDLDLGVGVLGVLFGFYFAVAALFSAPMGRLVERRGWVDGIRMSGLGSGLALVGVAALGRNVWSLGAVFVIGGVASALSHPAANMALARSVPGSRQGLLFGVKHVAVPSAVIFGGLAVPAFALTIGWRWAFAAAAVGAFATALGVPRLTTAATSHAPAIAVAARPQSRMRTLLMLAAAAAFGIAAMDGLATFLVAYAVDLGIAEGPAGLLLAGGSVAGLVTRLWVGWMVDRRGRTGLAAMGGLMGAGSLGLAVMASGGEPALVVGAMLAFVAGWGWSGLMTFVVVWANPGAPAAATGISHTGTFVGAAIGPPVVGIVADYVSFSAAWWLTAGLLAAAAGLVAAVGVMGDVGGRRREQDSPQSTPGAAR